MGIGIVRGKRFARHKRLLVVGMALAASSALIVPSGAAAGTLKEELAPFAHCPVETPGVVGCVVSVTTSGEFVIGNSTVPVTKPVILQGGTLPPSVALSPPTDGTDMLSKTPLPVPGGLLGIELLGDLTGVTATAELTSPPEIAEAVTLPLKVKLDNPLLGASCYIGSNAQPIVMNLIRGTTNPPPPNKPITGSEGEVESKYGGQLLKNTGASLVDNSFSASGANGCGGILAPVVDLSVNLKEGLPSAAGHNTAILNGSLSIATAELVRDPPPEFGRCVKVAKNTGKYHTSNCSAGLSAGSFEWLPGVVNKGFTTSAGETKLQTVSKAKVTCASESGSGKYSGPKKVTGVSMAFTGCVGPGAAKCTTAGAGEGELVTKPLEGELGVISEGFANGKEFRKVGLDLFPVGHAGSFIEFNCGGTAQVIRGSVIGTVTSGKMSLALTQAFKAAKGKQVPDRFEGEPVDVLESSTGGGAFEQDGLTLKATQKSEEAVEVKAAA
jgi:hypothetical protein